MDDLLDDIGLKPQSHLGIAYQRMWYFLLIIPFVCYRIYLAIDFIWEYWWFPAPDEVYLLAAWTSPPARSPLDPIMWLLIIIASIHSVIFIVKFRKEMAWRQGWLISLPFFAIFVIKMLEYIVEAVFNSLL